MSLTPENGDRGCARVSVGHYSAHFCCYLLFTCLQKRRESENEIEGVKLIGVEIERWFQSA